MMRLIDADALIDDCKKYLNKLNPSRDGKECTRIHWLIGILSNAPTIEPERKKGKWEPIVVFDGYVDFRCSACHRYRFHNGEMRKKYKYCPNCGTKMEETE